MKHNLHKTKLFMYTSFVLCFLFTMFIETYALSYLTGILAIGSLLVSFRGVHPMISWLSFIFLMAGIFLKFNTTITWQELPLHMTSTALLLCLLFVLPFLNSAFKIGRFDQQISRLSCFL